MLKIYVSFCRLIPVLHIKLKTIFIYFKILRYNYQKDIQLLADNYKTKHLINKTSLGLNSKLYLPISRHFYLYCKWQQVILINSNWLLWLHFHDPPMWLCIQILKKQIKIIINAIKLAKGNVSSSLK